MRSAGTCTLSKFSLQNRKATFRVPAGGKICSVLTTSLSLGRVLVGAVAFAQTARTVLAVWEYRPLTPSVCLCCLISWYRGSLYELWSRIQIKNLNHGRFNTRLFLVINTEPRNWCLDRGCRQPSSISNKRETHLSAARHVPVCEKS